MLTVNKKKLYQAVCFLDDDFYMGVIDNDLVVFNDNRMYKLPMLKSNGRERLALLHTYMHVKFLRRWLKSLVGCGTVSLHIEQDNTIFKAYTPTQPLSKMPFCEWTPQHVGWRDYEQCSDIVAEYTFDRHTRTDNLVRVACLNNVLYIDYARFHKTADCYGGEHPDFIVGAEDCSLISRVGGNIQQAFMFTDGTVLIVGDRFEILCKGDKV